jgi:Sds3-like
MAESDIGAIVVASISLISSAIIVVLTYFFNKTTNTKLKDLELRNEQKLKRLEFENNEKLQKMSQEHQQKLADSNNQYQEELEKLRARLTGEKSEQDALRDYEYEARKRLYQEFEPVLFQLVELSDSALRRICRLSSVSKEGKLEGWLSDSYNYFTRTTTYRLIAPLAACKVLRS